MTAADDRLKFGLAAFRDDLAECGFVLQTRRPVLRQQQGVQLDVAGVGRKWTIEIDEVAVEVDVLVRHPAQKRKAMRIERMHVQHRHALRSRLLAPFDVVQRKHLHAAAAQALHAVTTTADDQQALGIGRTIEHHIHRQLFALQPLEPQRVLAHAQPGTRGTGNEARPGQRISTTKSICNRNHEERS